MRKMNLVVGTVSLGLGILIGVVSLAIATDPSAPSKLLAKMHLGTNNVTLTNQSGGNGQNIVQSNPSSALNPSNSNGNPADTLPQSHDGESFSTTSPNSSLTGGTDGIAGSQDTLQSSIPVTAQPRIEITAVTQQIIADYKQDIGIFFDAWKAPDMTTFRTKLAKGYGGQLLERHAKRAEQYIQQGIGLEVSKIDFDNVIVEKADANTATLKADYRYTASDYMLSEAESIGEPNEQTVHVRVNLVKTNQRWIVTGETLLN